MNVVKIRKEDVSSSARTGWLEARVSDEMCGEKTRVKMTEARNTHHS